MPVATLREHLILQLDLAAQVGSQIGKMSDQYRLLRTGAAVTFSTGQLLSFGLKVHPSLPANLGAFPNWILSGSDTLTGSA